MADPGIPVREVPTYGGHQHTILPNFPKKCMKSKEFGPGGVRPNSDYVDPPRLLVMSIFHKIMIFTSASGVLVTPC